MIFSIVILGLSFRLRAVNLLPVDYDEPIYLKAGYDYSRYIREGDWSGIINYENNLEHPPLFKLLYGVALSPLPDLEQIPQSPDGAPPPSSLPEPHFRVARLVSALIGTLEVLVMSIVNPLAGFIVAIYTYKIQYTSQIMLESLPGFTALITVLAFIRWRNQRHQVKSSYFWLTISSIALGLTASSKYIYVVVGFTILVYWLWHIWQIEQNKKKGLSEIIGWGILAVVIFYLSNPFIWFDPINRLKSSLLFNVNYSQGNHVEGVGRPMWYPISYLFTSVLWFRGIFLFLIDPLFTIFAVLGIKRTWKREPLFVFWLVIGLFFLFAWPTKWAQYILIIVPPIAICAVNGMKIAVSEPINSWWKNRKSSQFRQKRKEWQVSYRLKRGWREIHRAFWWLLPGTIVLAAIAFYPMLFQGAMSLTDFNTRSIIDGLNGGVWREAWLGLTGQVDPVPVDYFSFGAIGSRQVNYVGFWLLIRLLLGGISDILAFEIVWTLLAVLLQACVGLGIALMLNRKGVRFKTFWRVIFILPWAIPEFVAALIWTMTFDPKFGWFNLATLPWSQRPDYPGALDFAASWQQDPEAALMVLLVAATWYGFPFMMLASTAGLKMIPQEVYEAAAIDGASGWRMFRNITWPLILPLMIPAVIIRGIFTFNQFYLFYVFRTPQEVGTLAINSFFLFSEMGQYAISSVLNIFTVLVLIVLVFWFNRGTGASEGVTYA